MARPKRWKSEEGKHGIQTVTLSSWNHFHDLLKVKFLDFKDYVFRGQSNEAWKLTPTLNRFLDNRKSSDYEEIRNAHLNSFKFSLRGRLTNLKEIISDENELWALGQHHGLHTPLLDLSFSPYVAAYFAYYEENIESAYRVIYCISQSAIDEEIGDELILYKPMADYNPRLLSQSGLFIKFNTNLDIDGVLRNKFIIKEERLKLLKLRVPSKDRETCLKLLNRMNINHNTLFPDIMGACHYCNTNLRINNY